MLHLDAAVVLDFTDGGAHHVVDVGGAHPAAAGFFVGEHQQRFGVATHAGGEVVELVVVGQHVGVVHLRFEPVEHGQLTVDERTVASGHVDEDVGNTFAQHGPLLFGNGHERALHGVERIGQFGELVAALGVHGVDGRQRTALGVTHGVHQSGQLTCGHLVGGFGHGPNPLGDGPCEEPRDEHGERYGATDDADANEGGPASFGGVGFSLLDDRRADLTLERVAFGDEGREGLHVDGLDRSEVGGPQRSVYVDAEAGETDRHAAATELRRPLFGGDDFELVHGRLELVEAVAGRDQCVGAGGVGGELVDTGDHLAGREVRFGDLLHGEQLATQLRVAGSGRQQASYGHEFARGESVCGERLGGGDHVGGSHVDVAAGGRQR